MCVCVCFRGDSSFYMVQFLMWLVVFISVAPQRRTTLLPWLQGLGGGGVGVHVGEVGGVISLH